MNAYNTDGRYLLIIYEKVFKVIYIKNLKDKKDENVKVPALFIYRKNGKCLEKRILKEKIRKKSKKYGNILNELIIDNLIGTIEFRNELFLFVVEKWRLLSKFYYMDKYRSIYKIEKVHYIPYNVDIIPINTAINNSLNIDDNSNNYFINNVKNNEDINKNFEIIDNSINFEYNNNNNNNNSNNNNFGIITASSLKTNDLSNKNDDIPHDFINTTNKNLNSCQGNNSNKNVTLKKSGTSENDKKDNILNDFEVVDNINSYNSYKNNNYNKKEEKNKKILTFNSAKKWLTTQFNHKNILNIISDITNYENKNVNENDRNLGKAQNELEKDNNSFLKNDKASTSSYNTSACNNTNKISTLFSSHTNISTNDENMSINKSDKDSSPPNNNNIIINNNSSNSSSKCKSNNKNLNIHKSISSHTNMSIHKNMNVHTNRMTHHHNNNINMKQSSGEKNIITTKNKIRNNYNNDTLNKMIFNSVENSVSSIYDEDNLSESKPDTLNSSSKVPTSLIDNAFFNKEGNEKKKELSILVNNKNIVESENNLLIDIKKNEKKINQRNSMFDQDNENNNNILLDKKNINNNNISNAVLYNDDTNVNNANDIYKKDFTNKTYNNNLLYKNKNGVNDKNYQKGNINENDVNKRNSCDSKFSEVLSEDKKGSTASNKTSINVVNNNIKDLINHSYFNVKSNPRMQENSEQKNSYSSLFKNEDVRNDEKKNNSKMDIHKYLKTIQRLLSVHMYYSYDYDLTQCIQKKVKNNIEEVEVEPLVYNTRLNNLNSKKKKSFLEMCEKKYVWNYQMIKKMKNKCKIDDNWFCSIIQGYISYTSIEINKKCLELLLISRRSSILGGTRFNKRGINDDGYVANYVESEQIVRINNRNVNYVDRFDQVNNNDNTSMADINYDAYRNKNCTSTKGDMDKNNNNNNINNNNNNINNNNNNNNNNNVSNEVLTSPKLTHHKVNNLKTNNMWEKNKNNNSFGSAQMDGTNVSTETKEKFINKDKINHEDFGIYKMNDKYGNNNNNNINNNNNNNNNNYNNNNNDNNNNNNNNNNNSSSSNKYVGRNFENRIISLVQIRGSIPLFWKQHAMSSHVNIQRSSLLSIKAFKEHNKKLINSYGNNIYYINLLSQNKSNEKKLTKKMIEMINFIKKDKHYKEKDYINYIEYDFHISVKNKSFEDAMNDFINKILLKEIKNVSFFMEAIKVNTNNDENLNDNSSNNNIYDNDKDMNNININNINNNKNKNKDYTYDNGDGENKKQSGVFQNGVFRTNCLDCLDRTNVFQYYYALFFILYILHLSRNDMFLKAVNKSYICYYKNVNNMFNDKNVTILTTLPTENYLLDLSDKYAMNRNYDYINNKNENIGMFEGFSYIINDGRFINNKKTSDTVDELKKLGLDQKKEKYGNSNDKDFNKDDRKKVEQIDEYVYILKHLFKKMWVENGDIISTHYTGTGSVFSSQINVGRSSLSTNIDHAIKSIERFYQNNFEDNFRQECIDIILCNGKYNNNRRSFLGSDFTYLLNRNNTNNVNKDPTNSMNKCDGNNNDNSNINNNNNNNYNNNINNNNNSKFLKPSMNNLQPNKFNLKNKKLLKENHEKGNKQESKVLSKRKRALLKLKKISAAYNINTNHNWKNFIHNTNFVKDLIDNCGDKNKNVDGNKELFKKEFENKAKRILHEMENSDLSDIEIEENDEEFYYKENEKMEMDDEGIIEYVHNNMNYPVHAEHNEYYEVQAHGVDEDDEHYDDDDDEDNDDDNEDDDIYNYDSKKRFNMHYNEVEGKLLKRDVNYPNNKNMNDLWSRTNNSSSINNTIEIDSSTSDSIEKKRRNRRREKMRRRRRRQMKKLKNKSDSMYLDDMHKDNKYVYDVNNEPIYNDYLSHDLINQYCVDCSNSKFVDNYAKKKIINTDYEERIIKLWAGTWNLCGGDLEELNDISSWLNEVDDYIDMYVFCFQEVVELTGFRILMNMKDKFKEKKIEQMITQTLGEVSQRQKELYLRGAKYNNNNNNMKIKKKSSHIVSETAYRNENHKYIYATNDERKQNVIMNNEDVDDEYYENYLKCFNDDYMRNENNQNDSYNYNNKSNNYKYDDMTILAQGEEQKITEDNSPLLDISKNCFLNNYFNSLEGDALNLDIMDEKKMSFSNLMDIDKKEYIDDTNKYKRHDEYNNIISKEMKYSNEFNLIDSLKNYDNIENKPNKHNHINEDILKSNETHISSNVKDIFQNKVTNSFNMNLNDIFNDEFISNPKERDSYINSNKGNIRGSYVFEESFNRKYNDSNNYNMNDDNIFNRNKDIEKKMSRPMDMYDRRGSHSNKIKNKSNHINNNKNINKEKAENNKVNAFDNSNNKLSVQNYNFTSVQDVFDDCEIRELGSNNNNLMYEKKYASQKTKIRSFNENIKKEINEMDDYYENVQKEKSKDNKGFTATGGSRYNNNNNNNKENDKYFLNLRKFKYVKLKSVSMIGLFIIIFIDEALVDHIREIEVCKVKVGLKGNTGNKGSVSVKFRLGYNSFCFNNIHLASGQTNIFERNTQMQNILSNSFQNQELNNLFNFDYFFACGDFNFRINKNLEEVLKLISSKNIKHLLNYDQFIYNKMYNILPFCLFYEHPILFNPTYKYKKHSNMYDIRRTPAWCDRVLLSGKLVHLSEIEKKKNEHIAREYYREHNMSIDQTNKSNMVDIKKNDMCDKDILSDFYNNDKIYFKYLDYKTHNNFFSSDHKPVSALIELKVFFDKKDIEYKLLHSYSMKTVDECGYLGKGSSNTSNSSSNKNNNNNLFDYFFSNGYGISKYTSNPISQILNYSNPLNTKYKNEPNEHSFHEDAIRNIENFEEYTK